MKDEDDEDEEEDEEAESSGEENGDCEENGEKPAVKRDGTMVVTATVRSSIPCSRINLSRVISLFQVALIDRGCIFLSQEGEKFLEEAGHTIDGGTRGETEAVKAAIEESEADEQNGNKEDEKPDLKRKGTMQETIEV